jgi:uncharacterized protein (TIGR00725 family)
MGKYGKILIGVIGAGRATAQGYALAREVGRLIAEGGAAVVCGGCGGIMEGACRGCVEAGGTALGILPGGEPEAANPYVSLAVASNLGHARNAVIAQTARALIAIEGEYGTLSEMALGLKIGRPVIALGAWPGIPGVCHAATPAEAVALAFARIAGEISATLATGHGDAD